MCVCVFGYAVGTWPPVITAAERREIFLLGGVFLLSGAAASTDVGDGWLGVSCSFN